MGIDADAFLAYGYDIGDPSDYVYERREDEPPPWYDEQLVDDYGYEDVLTEFLLRRSGYEGERFGAEYWDAQKALGIEFRRNGGYEGTLFMHTKLHRAYWGGDKVITHNDLNIDPAWDQRLKWALEQLEIEINEEPAWTLFTFMG